MEFLQHPMMLIMYVPQLVFIDRKGVIQAQFQGGSDFFKGRGEERPRQDRGDAEGAERRPARQRSERRFEGAGSRGDEEVLLR
jgi:hypothetical protein